MAERLFSNRLYTYALKGELNENHVSRSRISIHNEELADKHTD
jgi:hypothetical protein